MVFYCSIISDNLATKSCSIISCTYIQKAIAITKIPKLLKPIFNIFLIEFFFLFNGGTKVIIDNEQNLVCYIIILIHFSWELLNDKILFYWKMSNTQSTLPSSLCGFIYNQFLVRCMTIEIKSNWDNLIVIVWTYDFGVLII